MVSRVLISNTARLEQAMSTDNFPCNRFRTALTYQQDKVRLGRRLLSVSLGLLSHSGRSSHLGLRRDGIEET